MASLDQRQREKVARQQYKLKKRRREKHVSALFTGFLMVACMLLGYLVATYEPESSQAQLVLPNGRVAAVQSIDEAGRLCESQADIEFGEKLIDTLIDDFSTRYDEPRNLFVVLLLSTVRQPNGTTDYRVHCHVIPDDSVVSYFKRFEVKT